jgi:D-tagatose-1,6-bisphosphate aldolase subunit GatZ/KbaZ
MQNTKNYFKNLIKNQKQGNPKGIYSVCSTNRYVLEAAFEKAKDYNDPVLIESTCNQVNQYGGYTGMTPMDFKNYVFGVADYMKFPIDRIILGGDHLGPFPFKDEKSNSAIEKAHNMVKEYIKSGFGKIHIDPSMKLADDCKNGNAPLDKDIIAKRCVDLIKTSEEKINELRKQDDKIAEPVYVIGTDIPAPGGSDEVVSGRRITKVSEFKDTVNSISKLLNKNNLSDVWDRVIAVVVQPGVEHGNQIIIDYDRIKARKLTNSLKEYPNFIFEGHATDYQTRKGLKEMVEDGIAILKVGPSLTNALREAVFALNYIEEELFGYSRSRKLSNIREVLDSEMLKNPRYWKDHYKGDKDSIRLARKYSLFDRSRYYWGNNSVKESLDILISNLRSIKIPLSLISQFLPIQFNMVREGTIEIDPVVFIRESIKNVLDKYFYAIGINNKNI